MNSNRILRIVAFALAALVVVWFFQPSEEIQDTSPSGEALSTPQSGMIVNIDPATGKPMETIPSTAPVPATSSTSSEGLIVVPSSTPGGGEMIDLQGRFQNSAVVSVGDSDSVKVECIPKDASSTDEGATPKHHEGS